MMLLPAFISSNVIGACVHFRQPKKIIGEPKNTKKDDLILLGPTKSGRTLRNNSTINSPDLLNFKDRLNSELACLLLQEHTHNSIYSWLILNILREIAIQEVHPRLTDQPLTMTRVVMPLKKDRDYF
jgi:hypothetical protein